MKLNKVCTCDFVAKKLISIFVTSKKTVEIFHKIAYNGTQYHGWQYQPNAASVQETMNKAFSVLLIQLSTLWEPVEPIPEFMQNVCPF
jgi:hypothetical protein